MDWHRRFLQQAAWTHDLRSYLFEQAGLSHARRVVEIGCGTGAILSGLPTPATIYGLDVDPVRLVEACRNVPTAVLVCGNALGLPFPSNLFDITFCHFLLLWVRDPLQALLEMKRVTRSGGSVLALAEPDYSSRVDKPDALAPLGHWQAESLRHQGADPGFGSRLAMLFQKAGLQLIETGTLQSSPGSSKGRGGSEYSPTLAERNLEWAVLEADLAGWIPVKEISQMKLLDEQAWELGTRLLHVPTHFAWGKV
jgi:SAM-dependent methyltransferase